MEILLNAFMIMLVASGLCLLALFCLMLQTVLHQIRDYPFRVFSLMCLILLMALLVIVLSFGGYQSWVVASAAIGLT